MEGFKKDIGEYSDEYIQNYVDSLGNHTHEPYLKVPRWEYRFLVEQATKIEILERLIVNRMEDSKAITIDTLADILDIPAEAVVEE